MNVSGGTLGARPATRPPAPTEKSRMSNPNPRIAVISPAQRAVVGELVRDGADNAVIGARLNITTETVKSHLKTVFKATGCPNRTALACALLRGQVKLRTESQPARQAHEVAA